MVPLYKVPRAVKIIEVGPRLVDVKEASYRELLYPGTEFQLVNTF